MQFFRDTRKFLLFFFGQTISQLGSGMTALALIIWSYTQRGTVMSVALLSVCSYVPKALVSTFAGSIVDRGSKKTLMLVADSLSAMVTLTVLWLFSTDGLRVEYLYIINALLGVLGAFQSPAADVVATLLIPRQHYMRMGGLQSLGGSLLGILTPVLATAALAFGGLKTVLIIDLATFSFAFLTLLALRIPHAESERRESSVMRDLREGLRFLGDNRGVKHILYYLALINLIAGIGYYSVLNPMILARTGGNELALGYVSSCIAAGAAVGALVLTVYVPRTRKTTLMCVCYMFSFLTCDMALGIGRSLPVWCVAAFLGNLTLPHGDSALGTLLRCGVPVNMQGRVYALRNALCCATLTVGYLLGGALADCVAEPLVRSSAFLSALLGTGEGREMGVIYLFTGATGTLASLLLLKDKSVRALDGASVAGSR